MSQGNLALGRSAVPVMEADITSHMLSAGSQKVKGRIKSLAEAVILQSIEDLFDPKERKKSIDFFKGDNFSLYAKMAGLNAVEQIRIFKMLVDSGSRQSLFERQNNVEFSG